MSLDKFTKPDKNKDGTKGPVKPDAKIDAVKNNKEQKAVKNSPTKNKVKSAKVKAEEYASDEDGEDATLRGGTGMDPDADAEIAGVETTAARESALKAMGLEKYALTCPACKYKKELRISGELKPHQLLCKKCGGQMKASKKA